MDDPLWNGFWSSKLLSRSRAGIVTFSRPLRYRAKTDRLSDNIEYSRIVGEEKGIDVRIALDVMRMARRDELDVALIFSQDQDFSEVVDEIKALAHEQSRWIKVISAFPISASSRNKRGINNTDWIKIDRATYDACIDPKDYRPKRKR